MFISEVQIIWKPGHTGNRELWVVVRWFCHSFVFLFFFSLLAVRMRRMCGFAV